MRHILALLIGFFSFTSYSQANHLAGASIHYQFVSDSVYDFYFTYYRNCDGATFSNPSAYTSIRCAGGGCGTTFLNLTLVSISNVSGLCKTAGNPCYPVNTGFTGKGLEEHIYKARIDFRTSTFKYLSYYSGDLIVESNLCCRTPAITTGPGSTDIYIYTQFNLANNPKNSSPKFIEHPQNVLCCNVPAQLNFAAYDTDGDSLSYYVATPRNAYGSVANYTGKFSANMPLPIYDPTGKGVINPNANPPIGYYVGPTDGLIIFTPEKCDAVSPIVIMVSEWRKNGSGNYVKIGTIMREIVVETTTCANNNNPNVIGNNYYNICEGDSISFLIKSYDYVKTPPPPLPKPDSDSVSLSWNGGIKGATFTLVSDTALYQSARFSWRPGVGSSSSTPYSFMVKATDNHCPRPGVTYQKFSINVSKEPVITRNFGQIVCGKYQAHANFDTVIKTNISWEVFDYKWTKVSDSLAVAFESNKSTSSNLRTDYLTIYKSGKYYLRLIASTPNCSKTIIDSFYTLGYFNPTRLQDTAICLGQSFSMSIDSVYNSLTTNFKWTFAGKVQTDSTFTVVPPKGKTKLFFEATGNDGCVRKDELWVRTKYMPQPVNIKDTAICALKQHTFSTIDVLDSGLVSNKYTWSTGETTKSVNRFFNAGTQWVQIQNECGASFDSFFIQSDSLFQPDLIPDKLVCDQFIFKLTDLNYKPNVKYKWSTGETTPAIFVKTDGSYKVTASNDCGQRSDSVNIEFLNSPKIDLGADILLKKPFNQVLDAGNANWKYLWNTGETTSAITASDFGTYWVEVSNGCGKYRDSINLIMNVGINDNALGSLSIFPNPSNGTFIIPFVLSEVVDIRIMDELGQNIAFNKKLIGHQFQIEIPNAISGVYLVELHGHGFVQRGRLVVLR